MIAPLSAIKVRLSIDAAETQHDTLLTAFAAIIQGAFESRTQRRLDYRAAETYTVPADATHLIPQRLPVYSVSLWETKSDEVTGWEPETDVSYLHRDPHNIILLAPLGTYLQSLRITYAGGYTMPEETAITGVEALPDDLAACALEEIAQLWQHRDKLGVSMEWSPGVTGSQFRKLDLLPHTNEVLIRYRRQLL